MSPRGASTEALARWCSANAAGFTGQLLFDEPLSKHVYYRIGGPAAVLAFPKSRGDLEWLSKAIRESGSASFVLGAGSNCLVSDRGFDGLVAKTGRLNLGIEARGDRLVLGASVAISSLLRRASQEGWGGLEFLTGIPGSIGGAVRMNAGTHLGESSSRITKVEAFDLGASSWETFEGDALRFEYRKNRFLPDAAVVYETEWAFASGEPSSIKAAIDSTLQRRKATQPLDFPSCGSVFKNPRSAGLQAWQVVDRLGLRGHRIGNAQFAELHSNWILNLGSAGADDVRGLISLAKTRAKDELGVELEEEVVYVGF